MDFITGKQFPRRTFLRGVGATMALPFLDAMVPAGRLRAATRDPIRLVCIEEVHGLAGCNNWGASKFLFAPETTGRDFTLVPDNALKSLEPFRDSMTIVSNNPKPYTYKAELIGGEKAAPARSCSLPANNRLSFESWPQKADAVRLSDFKVAPKGGACP